MLVSEQVGGMYRGQDPITTERMVKEWMVVWEFYSVKWYDVEIERLDIRIFRVQPYSPRRRQSMVLPEALELWSIWDQVALAKQSESSIGNGNLGIVTTKYGRP